MSADDTTARRDFRVSGVVQGVGFRWAAARRAESLGLRGWVRNCPDGSVETAAEGPAPALGQYEEWLSRGPRGATVDRVERIAASLAIPSEGFLIVR